MTVDRMTTITRDRSPIHERFDQLLDRMHRTFAFKDNAYAGEVPLTNIRRSERIGVPPSVATFIRMTDKFSRMENLIRDVNAGIGDESMLDNAFDLAVYAIIFTILREEENGTGTDTSKSTLGHGSGHLWKGSMVESLVEDSGKVGYPIQVVQSGPTPGSIIRSPGSPGSAAIPPFHPTPSPALHPRTTSVPSSSSTPIVAAHLAQLLYTWYISQFSFRDVMAFSELDPVTQSAWVETAKKVFDHFLPHHNHYDTHK